MAGGRPKGAVTQELLRRSIQAGKLIKLIEDHAVNGTPLEPTRLDAAKFLIGKVLANPVPKDDEGKTPPGPLLIAWQQ